MRKIKGLRWYMIGLVTIGTVLGYLTRNAIAVAAPTLEDTLHITTQQYSYIVAAYSACYTVMQPVAGYVLTCSAPRSVTPCSPFFGRCSVWAPRWPTAGRAGAGARRGRHGRGGDDPRRAEGQQRVVSGQRAFDRRRLFQRRFVDRRHARPAAGGMGHRGAQLGDGVHHHRRAEPDLGHLLAAVLQAPERSEETEREERRYILEGRSAAPDLKRQKMSARRSCATASSGASRCRAFWRNRLGHLQRPDPTVHVQGLRL